MFQGYLEILEQKTEANAWVKKIKLHKATPGLAYYYLSSFLNLVDE